MLRIFFGSGFSITIWWTLRTGNRPHSICRGEPSSMKCVSPPYYDFFNYPHHIHYHYAEVDSVYIAFIVFGVFI